jgi:hypothetical protein
MSLTDGAVAVLAQRAAELVGTDVAVRVAPSTEDDPYRWSGHGRGWSVRIGPAEETWIPEHASEDEAAALLRELAERVAGR